MSGTIHSTRGLRRLTRMGQPLRWRVIVFTVAVSVGALLIAWIDASTWTRARQLERDFAAVKTERFYRSIHLRGALRQLNDTLFKYHLKGQQEDLLRFRADALELQQWIAMRKGEVATEEERALFRNLEGAYAAYLRETADMQKRHGVVFARKQLDGINEKLRQHSAAFLDLAEQLMQVQRRAFSGFLKESQERLDSFQHLIKISLLLLILLAVSVVVLVYRGMITPLRVQLSESQAAIERQEKLAALGGLAAGVAHEIRNPLTAIKFRLFSLKKSLPAAMSDNEDATVIASEIHRLERIVKDFLRFARPTDPEPVNLLASRLLDEVRALLKSPLERAAIELMLDAPAGVWLHADPQQIKQVLINLVRNAAESIGRNGAITLRAAGAHASLGGVQRPVAIIGVTDTGKGIPPHVQKRLFDPFFTTKDGGTGLGLAIAARIVEKHGGLLRYQTEVNHGTTFEIVLPRLDDHATPTPHH